MNIAQAALSALLGYVVVFAGLILLMLVVMLLGRLLAGKKAAPAQTPPVQAAPAPLAPGSAGQVRVFDVPDREAALVMAVVAHRLGRPLNQLRFVSIKEVKQK